MDDASPVVVVELPAEVRSSVHVRTLLDACTVALRRGDCNLRDADGGAGRSDAIATITVESTERPEVLVEVRAESGTSASRQLEFRPNDSEAERMRSIGFTIASLAGTLGIPAPRPERAEEPRAPKKPPPPIREPKPEPRATVPEKLPPLHLGARFELGPGLDRGPVRLGGALFAGYDLPGQVLSVSAIAAEAVRSGAVGGVDLAWTRLGVGMSASVPLPARLEGRAGLLMVLERIAATEMDATTLVQQSRNRWLSGLSLEGQVRWPRDTPVGGIIGGYVVRLSGGTAVVSHGIQLASSPATEGGFFAGVEFRP